MWIYTFLEKFHTNARMLHFATVFFSEATFQYLVQLMCNFYFEKIRVRSFEKNGQNRELCIIKYK